MTDFDINIISTGSQGNCVVVDDIIMLDAGITRKKIEDSGYNLDNLKMLFVSHKHSDHANMPMIRYAIAKHHYDKERSNVLVHDIEVHIPEDVYIKLKEQEENRKVEPMDLTYKPANVFTHAKGQVFERDFNGVHYKISLHPQKHHDIINYGFVIEKTEDNKTIRMLYVTDLDTVEPTNVGPGLTSLGMFDTIVMEGNYDEIWLREYITQTMDVLDPNRQAELLTDKELDKYVRENYRHIPREMSAGLFRAVQNMRHLSKQQARAYVRNHLKPGGRYYEVHRSSMFYEKPQDWTLLLR